MKKETIKLYAEESSFKSAENLKKEQLMEAAENGTVLSAVSSGYCTNGDMYFSFNGINGVIPFKDIAYGIPEDEEPSEKRAKFQRNKSTCFKVTKKTLMIDDEEYIVLDRRSVQEEYKQNYIDAIIPGDVVRARVSGITAYGVFIDLGCGMSSFVSMSNLSMSKLERPGERLDVGQAINVVMLNREDNGRMEFSLKEVLGTWEENAATYHYGQHVIGIVRNVEKFGAYIELEPNLTALCESVEFKSDKLRSGNVVACKIDFLSEKAHKIKVSVIRRLTFPEYRIPLHFYKQPGDHMDSWVYMSGMKRKIETDFSNI